MKKYVFEVFIEEDQQYYDIEIEGNLTIEEAIDQIKGLHLLDNGDKIKLIGE